HSLVTDPNDNANVYIYISGSAPVRSPNELSGCSAQSPEQDPNSELFRIEVIQVPVAHPEQAHVVSKPPILAALAAVTGHGEAPEDVAAAAKEAAAARARGEFTAVIFGAERVLPAGMTRKWLDSLGKAGGGTQPRCRATDKPEWGADAIFTLANDQMTFRGYYKLPAPQTSQENCVAHNGSLIPVPGRDIMAQGWYQGGVSVFEFTDPARPREIAYFDRGPIDATKMYVGGSWSAYWYNGYI